MTMCSFADQFSVFDITPVENLFIDEYMLRAPGDYVKVYLYGLRMCYHPVASSSLPSMARELGLDEKTVENAFVYWERRGLLRRTSDNPPSFAFNNIKAMMVSGGGSDGEIADNYRSFNTALQDLFGTRLLRAGEYEDAYYWIEELGLKPEVVLRMVHYAMTRKGGNNTSISFKTLEKEARRWADRGIFTLSAAEDYLNTLSAAYDGARQVLRNWRINRAPTADEEALYTKWTQEWGFDLQAILFACKETTKISQPNFSYLDKVMESRHKEGLLSAQEMASGKQQREDETRPVREVLDKLGLRSQHVSEELMIQYARWLGDGFEHEAILTVAGRAARRGRATMEDMNTQLKHFSKKNMRTNAQITDFYRRLEAVREILDAAGARRDATTADVATLSGWEQRGYTKPLILTAAEYARGTNDPIRYMETTLADWNAKGILTEEAARQAHDAFIQQAAAQKQHSGSIPQRPEADRPSKEVGAHRYSQRKYTEEELEKLLFVDPDTLN